jgi:penicillin-binding protein 1C
VIVPVSSGAVRPRIQTPPDGAIYVIDPDIPRDRQRLAVAAKGAPRGAQLILENDGTARADQPFLWLPEPGYRTIILRTREGEELDRVRIEVRGLTPRKRGRDSG